jgi:hypothetical protein
MLMLGVVNATALFMSGWSALHHGGSRTALDGSSAAVCTAMRAHVLVLLLLLLLLLLLVWLLLVLQLASACLHHSRGGASRGSWARP